MLKLIQTPTQKLTSTYYVWSPEVSKILLWESEGKFLQAQIKALQDPLSRGTKDTEKYKTVRSKANLGIEALMKEGGQVSPGSLIANAMSLEMALHAWRR